MMLELHNNRPDDSIEWLFDLAGTYPLLSAQEEVAFDEDKWSAARVLQKEMMRDPRGANYLALWAENLVDNPPVLATMPNKQSYYLLRRDQSPLLSSGTLKGHLATLGDNSSSAASRLHALEALDMEAALAVGLAEAFLGRGDRHAMCAAILCWQTLWRVKPGSVDGLPRSVHGTKLTRLIDRYYKARNDLVNHNLRLVFSIAAKHTGQLPYRDLIQEGTLGLIRAAEKFRSDKGYRFSTYAFNWIGQSIRRANEQLGGAVRFPAGVRAKVSSIHRERIQFHNRYGYEPDRETLAALLDLELAELDRFQQLGDLAVSLDTSPSQDPSAPALIDSMSGGPFERPESDADGAWLHNVFEDRLAILSPDEKRVITRRWGLDGSDPASRKETARIMSVSTEWIRQLENSGLAKLKDDIVLQQVFKEQD